LPQIPLSVTDFNSSKISIYPNPTSSQLNLDIPFDYENFKGIIYDLSGREVKTFSNPNSIYVSDLNNGLYILNVTLDEVNFNQKFLKN
nr:T9SS type A sorting domain-containing protein [Flavobacterium sp.]